jgi:hypothetical protein
MPETTTASHSALIDGLLTLLHEKAKASTEDYPGLEIPVVRGAEDDGSSAPVAVVTIPGLREVLEQWLVTVKAELSADAAPIDVTEDMQETLDQLVAQHAEDLKTIQHQAQRLRELELLNGRLEESRRRAIMTLQGVDRG